MKILKQITLILLFLYLGEVFNFFFKTQIPSTVLGMIILFISLIFKIVKVGQVEETSNKLVDYISLFLVPSVLSIVENFNSIKNQVFIILFIISVSTIISMIVTGLVVETLQRMMKNDWQHLFLYTYYNY